MTSIPYGQEIQKTFDFVVKAGFITMPYFEYVADIQSQSAKYRLRQALTLSSLFTPCFSRQLTPAWKLSPTGLRLARANGLIPSAPPKFSSFHHDATALGIALELERLGVITSWTCEAQLLKAGMDRLVVESSRRGRKYSDLLMKAGQKTIALELEISRKSMVRYEQFLRGYMGTRGIDAVLIVYQNPLVRDCFETAIRRVRLASSHLPVHFLNLREFSGTQSQIVISSLALESLSEISAGRVAA